MTENTPEKGAPLEEPEIEECVPVIEDDIVDVEGIDVMYGGPGLDEEEPLDVEDMYGPPSWYDDEPIDLSSDSKSIIESTEDIIIEKLSLPLSPEN